MLSTMDDLLVEGAEEYYVTLTFTEQFGSFTPTAGGDRAVIVIMDDDCKCISTLPHTYLHCIASLIPGLLALLFIIILGQWSLIQILQRQSRDKICSCISIYIFCKRSVAGAWLQKMFWLLRLPSLHSMACNTCIVCTRPLRWHNKSFNDYIYMHYTFT